MRKTRFAGLTALSVDESVTEDNGAFLGRDRDTIDRYLELGAKTHRHNGAVGLLDPVSALSANAVASAGTIEADRSFSISYTLEDDSGGETLLAPSILVSTPASLDPPFSAPGGVATYEAGGDLPVDTYYYGFSFVDGGGGETPIGPATPVERQPGYTQAKVTLSGLGSAVATASAAGWRLYRAVGGGDFNYLASGTVDTYVDDGSAQVNCDLTPLGDEQNTTHGDNSLIVQLPSADARVSAATNLNVYLSDAGDFVGDVLLQQFPVASAGRSALYRGITTIEGQPPDVNTSIGGAHLIDPDSELLDWHWKRPVANEAALPVDAEEGDVRVLLDSGDPWRYKSGAWAPWEFTSSGGSGSVRLVSDIAGTVTDPPEIEFLASGGATVDVTASGSKAVVTIGGASGVGGGSPVNVNLWSPTVPGTPLTDDFTTDNLGTNYGGGPYTTGLGSLAVTGGHLTQSGASFSILSLPGGFDDPSIVSKFHTGTTPGDIGAIADLTGFALGISQPNNQHQVSVTVTETSLDLYLASSGSESSVDNDVISLSPSTDYWLEITRVGSLFTGNLYDADPSGNSPIATVTYTVTGDDATAIGDDTTVILIANVNAPSTGIAWYDDLTFDGTPSGATTPDVTVPGVTDIDFVAGNGIAIDIIESPAGHARVEISLAT